MHVVFVYEDAHCILGFVCVSIFVYVKFLCFYNAPSYFVQNEMVINVKCPQ